MLLRTKVDRLADLLSKKPISVDEASRQLGTKPEVLEFIARTLEKNGIVSVSYPAVGSPILALLKQLPAHEEKVPKNVDEEFNFTVSGIPVTVYVYRDAERRPFYNVDYPVPAPYTNIFLELIKPDIARDIPFEAHYFLTPERMQAYLPEIRQKIKQKMSAYFAEDGLDVIAGYLFISMYGMGEIEIFMGDDGLEEIAINTSTLPIAVYHRKYGWMKSNITLPDEESIANIASQIARRVGEQITIANPILDAFLTTGDRAAATLYPASTKGNTITIRKFAREPWTSVSFINEHTLSPDMVALLWQAVHYELNIIATGGTASGKTSMLNVLTQMIPPSQRVVTIEETRELVLPKHVWNWIPLLTRGSSAGSSAESKGKITMSDLLTTSLRLRPDRVILGEIRTPAEAEVLFDAMHTGHSVSSTFHADTAPQLLKRMLEAPFSIHATEIESVHLVVVQHRDRRKSIRRTYEISELTPGAAGTLTTNRLFLWRPRSDTFELVNKPRRYIEEVNLYTGMTEREINDDLKHRRRIINWMTENGYADIEQVSEVMRAYYNMPEVLEEALEGKKKLEKEFGEGLAAGGKLRRSKQR
jgi:flagellar protein FlaI